MPVNIQRQEPERQPEPIIEATISDRYGYRTITVRNTSTSTIGGRTIECKGRYEEQNFKFVAMMGDLKAFGEALIAIAEGR